MFQGGKTAQSWMLLLIIPTQAGFNYSPPELSVRLQVWPGAERPLHPITQFDLLTFHLFSNHDMTFRGCQVRGIPARGSRSSSLPPTHPPHPSHRGDKAPHYINHSDTVIAAVFPHFSMQIPPQISLIYSVSLPLRPAPSSPWPFFSRHSRLILDLRAHSHGNCVLLGHCFAGKSSGPILGF